MLQLVFIFLITPLFLGLLIRERLDYDHHGFFGCCFALGFIVMVGEFALICYPAVFSKTSFHIVCRFVYVIYLIQCLAILIWILKTKKIRLSKLISGKEIKRLLLSSAFLLMIVLCGFQIIRLLVFMPAEMRDTKTYSALVVDILQSDRLFLIDPTNGAELSSIFDIPVKYSMSTWYPFQSMVAYISSLHPLIIANTILPAYLLLLHYCIVYALGSYLFNEDHKSACLFTAFVAFAQEVTLFCHTPTMIKLIWPVWGKGTLSMIVVPAVLVLFTLFSSKSPEFHGYWFFTLLFIIVIAGCSMSTMAAIELPLEILILSLIWTKRKHSPRIIVSSILSCIPVACYAAVYYYFSSLHNMR